MNKIVEVSHVEIIREMLDLFSKSYNALYGIDLVITLLYNIMKNILPMQSTLISASLDASSLAGLLAYFHYKTPPAIENWDDLLLVCMSFVQR